MLRLGWIPACAGMTVGMDHSAHAWLTAGMDEQFGTLHPEISSRCPLVGIPALGVELFHEFGGFA
jgi:hypothetical protein